MDPLQLENKQLSNKLDAAEQNIKFTVERTHQLNDTIASLTASIHNQGYEKGYMQGIKDAKELAMIQNR